MIPRAGAKKIYPIRGAMNVLWLVNSIGKSREARKG